MKQDSLGDRVKAYEQDAQFSGMTLSGEHICVRLDGKNFSTYTKRVQKPYDVRLNQAMVQTMNSLLNYSGAKLGYTQSDEISLFIDVPENPESEVIFGAKVQKLVSLLASEATVIFNQQVQELIPELTGNWARFDCRVWTVPNKLTAADTFKWRMLDCLRNSVSMASHHTVGHRASLNKNTDEKIALLAENGVDWHQYPDRFKFGTFAEKTIETAAIPEELKGYSSNQGKEVFTRSVVKNYSLDQINDIYFVLGVQNVKQQGE